MNKNIETPKRLQNKLINYPKEQNKERTIQTRKTRERPKKKIKKKNDKPKK